MHWFANIVNFLCHLSKDIELNLRLMTVNSIELRPFVCLCAWTLVVLDNTVLICLGLGL